MKITQSHLDLWESAQRRPSWAAPLVAKTQTHRASLIDSCINAQVSRHDDLDVSNLLSLCFSYRKRGALRSELRRLVHAPGTLIRPERRSVWARRLLRRLEPA